MVCAAVASRHVRFERRGQRRHTFFGSLKPTWPTAMPPSFFRFDHGVNMIVTLSRLLPGGTLLSNSLSCGSSRQTSDSVAPTHLRWNWPWSAASSLPAALVAADPIPAPRPIAGRYVRKTDCRRGTVRQRPRDLLVSSGLFSGRPQCSSVSNAAYPVREAGQPAKFPSATNERRVALLLPNVFVPSVLYEFRIWTRRPARQCPCPILSVSGLKGRPAYSPPCLCQRRSSPRVPRHST